MCQKRCLDCRCCCSWCCCRFRCCCCFYCCCCFLAGVVINESVIVIDIDYVSVFVFDILVLLALLKLLVSWRPQSIFSGERIFKQWLNKHISLGFFLPSSLIIIIKLTNKSQCYQIKLLNSQARIPCIAKQIILCSILKRYWIVKSCFKQWFNCN